MASLRSALLFAPVLCNGLSDIWSQEKNIPGLHPQHAPSPGSHGGDEAVRDILDNTKKGLEGGVSNPMKRWVDGISSDIKEAKSKVDNMGKKVAHKVEKAAEPVVKRTSAEVEKRKKSPPRTSEQTKEPDAGKLLNAQKVQTKVVATAAQAANIATAAHTDMKTASQVVQKLAFLANENRKEDGEEFKEVMENALSETFEDERWREDPYKQDEIEHLSLSHLPTDAMIDAMWAMKAPSDEKIMQVWNDMQARALTKKEQELTTNEVNAWIKMVMTRRRDVRKQAILHPQGPATFEFSKKGKTQVGTVNSNAMNMFANQDSLPTPEELQNLPSDSMVAKMWSMENPTNAAMREVWKEMLEVTKTEKEKELVSREVQDWIKLVMNKRKARKFREQVLQGPSA